MGCCLYAYLAAGSLVDRPAVLLATVDQPSEKIGALIGPYKLLKQIGAGGMWIVYVAEQTEPVRRRVVGWAPPAKSRSLWESVAAGTIAERWSRVTVQQILVGTTHPTRHAAAGEAVSKRSVIRLSIQL